MGYCIDLLQELSKNLSFVYTLHLVADNKYGSYEKVREPNNGRDSIIGRVTSIIVWHGISSSAAISKREVDLSILIDVIRTEEKHALDDMREHVLRLMNSNL